MYSLILVGMPTLLLKWRVVDPDAAVGTTMEKASTAPSVERDISLKAEVRRRSSRARRLPCVCFQCMTDSNTQDSNTVTRANGNTANLLL